MIENGILVASSFRKLDKGLVERNAFTNWQSWFLSELSTGRSLKLVPGDHKPAELASA